MALASGLSAFMLIKVLAPGFYARQDTRTPVRIGIIAMVANMAINLVLVLVLHHYWRLGHAGLAAATSLAAYLNAFLLYRGLRRDDVYRPLAGWKKYALQLLLANAAMVALLVGLLDHVGDWYRLDWHSRALWLSLVCLGGAAVYGFVLVLAGLRPRHLRSGAGRA
jgi:putative peptidoglycan lipid II flippase